VKSSREFSFKNLKKAKPRMSRFARHPHVRFAHKSTNLDSKGLIFMRPILQAKSRLGLEYLALFQRTFSQNFAKSHEKARQISFENPKKAKPRMSRFARHPHVRFAHKSIFLDG